MSTAESVSESTEAEAESVEAEKASRQPRIIRLGPQGGTYELVKPLAQGGMAEVFLARRVGSSGFRTEVAIKRLRRELLAGADVRAMFLHEAKLAAHLSHPNIARVFDLQEVGIHHFLVMEYVHGATLRVLIQKAERAKKPLSPGFVCSVGAAVAEALHYANSSCDENGKPLRIVHRDISPHNICIGQSGEVKLIDFGIAWSQLEGRNETQGAKLKGKYAYMSPEQVGAETLDGRSDIFSLAIVLVEMLTGRRLFEAKSESQTLLRVLEAAPSIVKKATQNIPSGLREIIVRCLARDRDARFADGAQLATALRTHLLNERLVYGLLESAAEVQALSEAPEQLRKGSDPELELSTPPPAERTPGGKRKSDPAIEAGALREADAGSTPKRQSNPAVSIPMPPALPEDATKYPVEDTPPQGPPALQPKVESKPAAPSIAASESPAAAPGAVQPTAARIDAAAAVTDPTLAAPKRKAKRSAARWTPVIGGAMALAAAVIVTRAVSVRPAAAGSLVSQSSVSQSSPAAPAAAPVPAASAPAAAIAAPAAAAAMVRKATPVADEKRVAAPSSLQIRVFAGAPVKGARVRAIALARDGSVDTSVGEAGTLGTCAATTADGRCDLHLAAATLGGPLRIVASGAGARWVDPSDGMTQLSLEGIELSTTLAAMPIAGQRVPVTLFTTLADAAAAARAKSGQTDLKASLEEGDRAFAKHLGGGAEFSLRTAMPEALDAGSSAMTSGLRAALAEAALGEWAHELAAGSGAGRAFNAAALAQLLAEDVAADGRFDGLGDGAQAIATPGRRPAALPGAPLRAALAHALDTFVNEAQPPELHAQAQRMSAAIRDDQSALF